MPNAPVRASLLLAVLLATIVAGCARTTGAEAPSTPVAQPSAPATPAPSEEPDETPAPTQPPATPEPSGNPVVVRVDPLTTARVTADGVALRVLPGLDQPLAVGYDFEGGAPELRLSSGDTVAIIWGPVLADGHTWYSVRSVDAGTLTWDAAWIAADYLVEDGRLEHYPLVASADGLGAGTAVSATVGDGAQLYVNAVATPMAGDESCTAEVVLINTAGTVVEIGSGTVTETTHFFSSPLERGELKQTTGGKVTLQVRTDCAWAAMAEEPIG